MKIEAWIESLAARWVRDDFYVHNAVDVKNVCTALCDVLTAIRTHRDARGDDRCWMDDEELYKILPEGYEPPARDSTVELKNCERYIACRYNPGTVYISPEREIEQLRQDIANLKQEIVERDARIDQLINKITQVLDQIWECGCGTVNGVNLAFCRVCLRPSGVNV